MTSGKIGFVQKFIQGIRLKIHWKRAKNRSREKFREAIQVINKGSLKDAELLPFP